MSNPASNPSAASAKTPRRVPAGSRKPENSLLAGLAILALTFLIYLPALKAGFIWDDNDMLTEQHLIKASDGLSRLWFSTEPIDYFPLTMSSLWVEWRLWGMKAAGYHFTNILLHAGSALLLWRLLRRLAVPGAWWAALLFALHPVNVESVAWITERKNTLAMFFYMLSALCFVRSENNLVTTGRPASGKCYGLALVAFALSLLSKTQGVTLPCALLGLIWWRRGQVTRADLVRVAPFFALSLVMGLVTVWFQYQRAIVDAVVNENSLPARAAGAGWAVWFYLGKALLPWKLTFVYPRWVINAASPAVYLPGVGVLLTLALLWWKRAVWGRGAFFAFAYFVGTLFPVLGFFSIYFHKYSFVADHWQYFALPGVIVVAVSLLAERLQKKSAVVLGILALACATASVQQAKIYTTQETLWRDTLAKNPDCWMAHGNWGLWLYNQGFKKEAMEHYALAVELKPDDEGWWHNWGVALFEMRQPAQAAEKFERVVKLKPNHPLALMSLASIRAISADPALRNGVQAVQLAERGVQVTQEKDEWQLDTLAAAYAEAGDFDRAVKTQEKAIQLAELRGVPPIVEEMRGRLRLFQAGMPFREAP